MSGTKSTCSSPTVLGFCKMTELHCAGQRKEKADSSKGPQALPFSPQPSFGSQYVDVQSIKASVGVRKDCAREKNAKPMMYATVRRTKSQGDLKGRVIRIRAGSKARLWERRPVYTVKFRKGTGSVR
ncbi:hypothetical protein PHLCEN_2v598 [Hermanssonia centrifuga]|uniref:Uncharacterized protein n=1 Tax=Hermanssonia centrifuga TaxID=98765 RepID=A0A2R6S5P1_9APHY|nr:hypothetical protein PHLCEN_2v598 [Hermanssonia centrifuga]